MGFKETTFETVIIVPKAKHVHKSEFVLQQLAYVVRGEGELMMCVS